MLGYLDAPLLNIDFCQWSFVFKNSSLKSKKRIHCEKLIRSFFVDLQKEIVSLIKWAHCFKHFFNVLFRNFLFGNDHILHCFEKIFNTIFFLASNAWFQIWTFNIFANSWRNGGEKSLSVSIIISAMAFD